MSENTAAFDKKTHVIANVEFNRNVKTLIEHMTAAKYSSEYKSYAANYVSDEKELKKRYGGFVTPALLTEKENKPKKIAVKRTKTEIDAAKIKREEERKRKKKETEDRKAERARLKALGQPLPKIVKDPSKVPAPKLFVSFTFEARSIFTICVAEMISELGEHINGDDMNTIENVKVDNADKNAKSSHATTSALNRARLRTMQDLITAKAEDTYVNTILDFVLQNADEFDVDESISNLKIKFEQAIPKTHSYGHFLTICAIASALLIKIIVTHFVKSKWYDKSTRATKDAILGFMYDRGFDQAKIEAIRDAIPAPNRKPKAGSAKEEVSVKDELAEEEDEEEDEETETETETEK